MSIESRFKQRQLDVATLLVLALLLWGSSGIPHLHFLNDTYRYWAPLVAFAWAYRFWTRTTEQVLRIEEGGLRLIQTSMPGAKQIEGLIPWEQLEDAGKLLRSGQVWLRDPQLILGSFTGHPHRLKALRSDWEAAQNSRQAQFTFNLNDPAQKAVFEEIDARIRSRQAQEPVWLGSPLRLKVLVGVAEAVLLIALLALLATLLIGVLENRQIPEGRRQGLVLFLTVPFIFIFTHAEAWRRRRFGLQVRLAEDALDLRLPFGISGVHPMKIPYAKIVQLQRSGKGLGLKVPDREAFLSELDPRLKPLVLFWLRDHGCPIYIADHATSPMGPEAFESTLRKHLQI